MQGRGDDAHQVAAHLIGVDLVAKTGSEGVHGLLAVISGPVEPAVDDALDAVSMLGGPAPPLTRRRARDPELAARAEHRRTDAATTIDEGRHQ